MSSRKPRSLRRTIAGVGSLVLAAGAWFFFAPQSIGGAVAYTVVTGQSMEPTLRADDLVLVRERSSYGLGDAIAYRSDTLSQVVLHRIVEQKGSRFVTQGDNNDFLDSDRPSGEDVLGTMWIRVPGGGKVVNQLRSPVGLALAATAGLGLLGFFSVKQRRRRHTARHRRTEDAGEIAAPRPVDPLPTPATAPSDHRPLQAAAAAMAACILGFALAAALAFQRPLFTTETVKVDYSHSGTFDYRAPAPDGPVYQTRYIEAGDPVFVRLVRDLDVDFDYKLQSDAARSVTLDGDLVAVIRADNGWKHEIPVATGTATGDELELAGRLDLAAVRDLLGRIERMTGMAPGTYSISLEPRIETTGTIAGETVDSKFAPALPFHLNTIQLGLVREPGRDQTLVEQLNPSQGGSVTVKRAVPNPFTIAGRDVPVIAVRRVGAVGAGVSLLCLLAVAWLLLRRRPTDEASRIAARHGSILVPVTDGPDLRQETADVADFSTLVRLAQQFELPIMHRAHRNGSHSYVLYYDGLAYRYRIAGDDLVFSSEPEAGLPAEPQGPRLVHAVLTRPVAIVDEPPPEQGADVGW